jgi:hypothetical protein
MISEITTNAEPIYKQWYAKAYENLFYREHPLMGMIAKERAGGEQVKQAIKIAPGAGQSATYANANTNQSTSTRRAFLGDWGKDYSLAKVDNTLIDLSENSMGAIIKMLADETESAVVALGNRLERDLFRSGYGELGTVSSGQATTTITLTNRADAQNFFPGQVLVAASGVASGALLNSGATVTLSAVDKDAGTISAAAAFTGSIAALAGGSVFFQQGDRQDAASPTAYKVVGLAGWLPLTAPGGSDSFFNVNRSTDAVALAGVRLDGRGKTMGQALYQLAVRIGENGGAPDVAFLSFDNFGTLALELDNKAIYENIQGAGITTMYESITIAGPKGRIRVFPSQFCQSDRGFVLTKRDWTIYCGGAKDPMYPTLRGVSMLDVYNEDAVQIRHKTLAQLMCAAPGHSGTTQLA